MSEYPPDAPCVNCEHLLREHPPDQPCCEKCTGWTPDLKAAYDALRAKHANVLTRVGELQESVHKNIRQVEQLRGHLNEAVQLALAEREHLTQELVFRDELIKSMKKALEASGATIKLELELSSPPPGKLS